MPDERELRDYILPFLDVDDPVVIRMRHEPDPASARLLVSLGAGWIVDEAAPSCVRACGRPECGVRDVSAHDLTRTRFCADAICPDDALTGSDFCRRHQSKVKAAAPVKTRKLGVAQRETLELLADGPLRTREIAMTRRVSGPAVVECLRGLLKRGLVVRVQPGLYGLANAEAAVVPVLEEARSDRLGPDGPASSSTDLLRNARLRVVQRIAAVREEIDAMERELLEALEEEAA